MEEFKARGTLEPFSESYESNPLNELDHRFYQLDEDTRALRIAFIRNSLWETETGKLRVTGWGAQRLRVSGSQTETYTKETET